MRKYLLFLTVGCVGLATANAQDPHFTQFFAAPFTVNPAYTGVFEGQARLMTNYRTQWQNAIDPFTTAVVAGDFKIASKDREGQNPFNVGIQLMNDRSMKGAFKSNYATATASYHVPMDEAGFHSIGAGLQATYADRRVDVSSLSFDAQFTSGGFDIVNLPNNEAALQNLQPFVTLGAGLLYRYDNWESGDFVDLGISGYHFTQPQQSVFNDPTSILPMRWSAQFGYQKQLPSDIVVNAKMLFQHQAKVEYLLGGLSVGKIFGQNKDLIGLGCWYRSADAISPYVFCEFSGLQIGFSYDATISDLSKGPNPARSVEMSLQWRIGK